MHSSNPANRSALALLTGSLLMVVTMPLLAADIEAVRVWRAPDHTRLVFDLSESVEYNLFTLANPDRVVIDITDSSFVGDFAGLDFSDSPISGMRSALRDNSILRVVLDLSEKVELSSFTLGANGEFRDRLVVDLFDSVANPMSTARTTALTQPASQQDDRRDILVAVVAGHGGEDPGALSHDRRIMEKDITLAISRAIRNRLNAIPGYQPIMIRDGDYTVELEDRPKIGRENRVDIYLSIHADSYPGRAAQGVTIYALSGETADRENARRIAQQENRADLLGGSAGDTRIANVDDDLALTLLDLSMSWSIEQSVNLGTDILASLDGVARLRRDKVQAGNLWELRSPDIPSLLIETGYLSNPGEARQLASRRYQEQLANAIVQGLMNYFYDAPPAGTLIAWQKENGIVPGTYMVKRGDSLSVIAQRFAVSLAELKASNNLLSNTIHIGQVLTIPGGVQIAASEHTIRRGETLSEIAERYRISLANLRQANNIAGDHIRVGQVLKIPPS
ncbi:MAG: N-acetylmuramoyl-L-alanine amidase [Proteobacteria bacterium]|nr:N-acetylmuramoyl-L-alanine amidase [Pseudomonadota bacterium]